MDTTNERQLVIRAQAGDKKAFGEIVRLHQASLRGVAARLPLSKDEVFDLVQETFVRCWLNLKSFDSAQPFGPWSRTILRNLASNHVRDMKASRAKAQQAAIEAIAQGPTWGALLRDDLVDEAARMKALRDCCAALPPEQGRLLRMRYDESLTVEQIASGSDRSVASVAMALSRLRQALAACVSRKLEASS